MNNFSSTIAASKANVSFVCPVKLMAEWSISDEKKNIIIVCANFGSRLF